MRKALPARAGSGLSFQRPPLRVFTAPQDGVDALRRCLSEWIGFNENPLTGLSFEWPLRGLTTLQSLKWFRRFKGRWVVYCIPAVNGEAFRRKKVTSEMLCIETTVRQRQSPFLSQSSAVPGLLRPFRWGRRSDNKSLIQKLWPQYRPGRKPGRPISLSP